MLGRARDPTMATCARNICLWLLCFYVNIVINHIRGLDNTATDWLSRWQQTPDNANVT